MVLDEICARTECLLRSCESWEDLTVRIGLIEGPSELRTEMNVQSC